MCLGPPPYTLVQAHTIVGDIAETVIPALTIPLDLYQCTCDEMIDIEYSRFNLDIPGVTSNCLADPWDVLDGSGSSCLQFECTLSYGSTNLRSNAVIDPCSESVMVTVTDSATGDQVWREVFSQTRSVQFSLLTFTPTLYVTITHYNYSIEVSVSS